MYSDVQKMPQALLNLFTECKMDSIEFPTIYASYLSEGNILLHTVSR